MQQKAKLLYFSCIQFLLNPQIHNIIEGKPARDMERLQWRFSDAEQSCLESNYYSERCNTLFSK